MGQGRLNLPKVFCQAPTLGADRLFTDAGFTLVTSPEDAHWIVLGGGADINPALFGEKPIRDGSSYIDQDRDDRENKLITDFRGKKTFIGICRGAQLLNVRAGGRLWQHVDKHTGNHHPITFISGPAARKGTVNSVHHQQMIMAKGGVMIGWALVSSTRASETSGVTTRSEGEIDPEIIWYPKDKFYCFQAHPEFGHPETTEIFFRSLADVMPLTV